MYQFRLSNEYHDGVNEFLNLAFGNASVNVIIVCPCVKYGNSRWVTQSEVVDHLVCDELMQDYTTCTTRRNTFCYGRFP